MGGGATEAETGGATDEAVALGTAGAPSPAAHDSQPPKPKATAAAKTARATIARALR